MQSINHAPSAENEVIKPPFLYEIRVKGYVSREQWTSWFDNLAISTGAGESTLRGSLPDHAALYGLLARLRDLALPLIMVRVLDGDAQIRLHRQSRRYDLMINVLLMAVYLVLLGGLASLTVLVAPIISVTLALALLSGMLGVLAHVFRLWSGQAAWRWVSYVTWLGAAVALFLFIPLSGLLPPALGIAITLFLIAGMLLYLLLYLRRRAEGINMNLAGGPALAGSHSAIAYDCAENPIEDDADTGDYADIREYGTSK